MLHGVSRLFLQFFGFVATTAFFIDMVLQIVKKKKSSYWWAEEDEGKCIDNDNDEKLSLGETVFKVYNYKL